MRDGDARSLNRYSYVKNNPLSLVDPSGLMETVTVNARFAGEVDLPGDLVLRIRNTISYLESLQPAQIDGGEDKTISWQTRSSTKSMQGLPYLMNHLLPNVHFHVTTAYNILRHNGVEVGKQDYLGNG